MRILVVHNKYGNNSGDDQAVDLEVALLKGAGVEVQSWECPQEAPKGLMDQLRTSRDLSHSDKSQQELAKILEQFKPRLVHTHNAFPEFTPSLYDACIAAKVPVVQTLHDFQIFCASGRLTRNAKPCELCLGGSQLQALRHACVNQSRLSTLARVRMIRRHRTMQTWSKKVNAYIALSKFSAEKFVQGGLPKDKIFTKPRFAFAPPQETLRASDLYALYVGPLREENGIRTLLKAWEGLKTPLWIVGDGPLRSEVERSKSQFIKYLGDMPPQSILRIMSKAEFLLLPSESYEHFPQAAAEALSLGLPIVASRIGGLAEIVRHEKNGLLFEPGNILNLKSIVKKLADDVKLHDRLAEGARLDYLEKYSPKKNLKKLLEIYQHALRSVAKSAK